MSTNSIGGLTLQLVAEESLRTLVPQLVPLTKIAVSDFGSYVAERGTTVHTRYADAFVAQDYVKANGFAAQDAVSTDVAVTLATQKHVTIEFTDFEVATLSIERLRRLFMAPMANAVVKSLFDEVLGKVTAANFATTAYSGAKSGFNRISIANAATSLTKANLPHDGRMLLISPDAMGQLVQDPAVAQTFSYGNSDVIQNNAISKKLHGFDIAEYNGFPSSGDAFDEGLNGIASCREGLCVVTRVPAAPTTGGGEQTIVQDPESGFAYSLRYWYDWSAGLHKLSASWLVGSAIGNPAALQRIRFTS
jgi:hypothetical protein